jgi:hypothetical protein
MGYGNRIQNGSHDCRGVCQSLGFEGKTHQSSQSRPEQPEQGTSSWRIRSHIEGTHHPQASYLSPDQDVSFMPLRVGWH